jgi:hypothetical protein
MNRLATLALGTVALVSSGLVLPGSGVLAEQKTLKEQVVGTWAFSADENVAPDGTKRQLFGRNGKGLLVLAANGQYSQIIVRADVPKFKSDNRMEGTADENKAAVQGTTAAFGTWSVDEANKTLIVHVEGGLFPNQSGTDSIRTLNVAGDELKYVAKAGGGGTSTTSFKRVVGSL